jgi:hypothetical protein
MDGATGGGGSRELCGLASDVTYPPSYHNASLGKHPHPAVFLHARAE